MYVYHCDWNSSKRQQVEIYTWRPEQTEIELGDYLGDMTNELDESDYIIEFVSGGYEKLGLCDKEW